jgi:hypothetical protein
MGNRILIRLGLFENRLPGLIMQNETRTFQRCNMQLSNFVKGLSNFGSTSSSLPSAVVWM